MRLRDRIQSALTLVASALEAAAEEGSGHPAPMPVGGQAVIEGVVMKGYTRWGLAVRDPQGKIVREHWPVRGGKGPWGKIPVVRGFLNMIEMLREGFKALSRSASISLGEEDEMTTKDLVITCIITFLAVTGLFILLPVWLAGLLRGAFAFGRGAENVVEGCVRGLVFIAYLAVIGLWSDMARILAYHGAEHKTINAYESGGPVNVETVMKCSRLHPRCGTSFLLIVVIVSIIVFSIAGGGGILWRVLSRLCLIPVVVGISYEFIRAMWRAGFAGRCVMALPMTLQYLTTREPTPEQAEVGISALEEALDRTFNTEHTEALQ